MDVDALLEGLGPPGLAGTGIPSFVASAQYDDAAHQFALTIPGLQPSDALARPSVLYFIVPTAFPRGTDADQITVSVQGVVLDVTNLRGDPITEFHLAPQQLLQGVVSAGELRLTLVEPVPSDSAVFLPGHLAAIPDRRPAPDPTSGGFMLAGVTGYSDIDLDQDLNETDPQLVMGDYQVTQLSEWRGNAARAFPNTVNGPRGRALDLSGLPFGWTGGAHVFFYLDGIATLEVESVEQNGVNIPVVEQTSDFSSRTDLKLWRTGLMTEAQIKAHPFEVTVRAVPGTPMTYQRYAAVTQDPDPVAADFLATGARSSPNVTVLVPQAGWEMGRGYLHFALPSGQDAPIIAGQPAGINLIDQFVVRSTAPGQTVELNGDTMRTLSSRAPVFQMADRFSLFPWVIR